ncbi:MAG: glycosyltransferase family 4 protein [Candidatus Omnitrophota bacterium]|nr:glycosyltransferase family 4 protein [Candidatus Omnitrophota bacterium]
MKINLYGSNANMAYLIAKFLRRKGQDANVFVDENPIFECNLPYWEEGNNEKFPSWVKFVNVDLRRIIFRGSAERRFLNELSKCDIIHTIGESAIWASFTGTPYLYWSYGFDLDILPFKRGGIKNFLLSSLQCRTLRKAGLVLYPMPHQARFASRLKLSRSKFFLPMVPVDTQKYSKRNSPALSKLREFYNCDWLFLHPSRQEWMRDIPDNKGNDKLFMAFAHFVKNGNNAKMIVFEKGRDIADSKKLIMSLGIGNNVIWLNEQNKEGLINLYSISDIVFDQFNIGSPGLITWEALSIGLPTFVYMKEIWKDYIDELPPVINVSTEEEIFSMISKLCEDKTLRIDIGIRSRDWITKYFHWERVIEQYVEYYNQILSRAGRFKNA